eukprot:3600030-Rhodomonas_salina.2
MRRGSILRTRSVAFNQVLTYARVMRCPEMSSRTLLNCALTRVLRLHDVRYVHSTVFLCAVRCPAQIYAAICQCACHAAFGADLMRMADDEPPLRRIPEAYRRGIVLRTRYAMSGTDAMSDTGVCSHQALTAGRKVTHVTLHVRCAGSGTDPEICFDVFALRGGHVEPERREMVTIFFSDIVGYSPPPSFTPKTQTQESMMFGADKVCAAPRFTNISSEVASAHDQFDAVCNARHSRRDLLPQRSQPLVVEPEKIAHMLDRLYTRFDALSCHYGVFKVETIGGIGLRSCYAMSVLTQRMALDAYMAVTNLVEPQPDDHAIRIARSRPSARPRTLAGCGVQR